MFCKGGILEKHQNPTPISPTHLSSPTDWNPLQSHLDLNQKVMVNVDQTVTKLLWNINHQYRTEHCLQLILCTDSKNPTSLDSLLAGPSRREYRTSFPPRKRRSRYSSRKTAVRESWPWWPLKMDDLLVDSRSAERRERRMSNDIRRKHTGGLAEENKIEQDSRKEWRLEW